MKNVELLFIDDFDSAFQTNFVISLVSLKSNSDFIESDEEVPEKEISKSNLSYRTYEEVSFIINFNLIKINLINKNIYEELIQQRY